MLNLSLPLNSSFLFAAILSLQPEAAAEERNSLDSSFPLFPLSPHSPESCGQGCLAGEKKWEKFRVTRIGRPPLKKRYLSATVCTYYNILGTRRKIRIWGLPGVSFSSSDSEKVRIRIGQPFCLFLKDVFESPSP